MMKLYRAKSFHRHMINKFKEDEKDGPPEYALGCDFSYGQI